MSSPSKPVRAAAPRPRAFTPVATRARHNGWTAPRQVEFVEALAECGCVEEACRRVGISAAAAYQLRRRPDPQSFRQAWDAALDHAIRRLSDAAFARAIHGVSRPVFFQGEQIGERRHYDERLTMFLLRYRDPERYGAWLDDMRAERHPDGAAITLDRLLERLGQDASIAEAGLPPLPRPPLATRQYVSPEQQAEDAAREEAAREAAAERADDARREAEWQAHLATLPDSGGDVA